VDSLGTLVLSLLQFLPILFIVIYALFGGSGSRDPTFSLSKTAEFSVPRKTSHDIPYFVKKDFDQYYRTQQAVDNFEEEVEDFWLRHRRRQCNEERQQKHNLYRNYKYFEGTSREEEFARRYENFKTPACDELNKHGVDY
jgi:hypothetical protein